MIQIRKPRKVATKGKPKKKKKKKRKEKKSGH